MQFQEITVLMSHIQIPMCSMSCTGKTSEKLQKKLKTLNIQVIFQLANFAGKQVLPGYNFSEIKVVNSENLQS